MPDKKKRGPEAERLVIPGEWEQVIAKAMKKKKPASGWPKPAKRAKKRP